MIRVAVKLHDAAHGHKLWMLPLAHVAAELAAKHDILWGVTEDPDITWVGSFWAEETPGPIIIHDFADAASLSLPARRLIADPRVRSVVKISKFLDPADYNAPHGHGVYRADTVYRDPQVSVADTAKIITPWGWLHYGSMTRRPADTTQLKRSVDVIFAGSVHYPSQPVTTHRLAALQAILGLPGTMNTLIGVGWGLLPQQDYVQLLWQSKIAVCPWGWGETCMRDIEAMLAGCIVIKPRTEFVSTYPDYQRFPTCLWCEPDFSDLTAVVEDALSRRAELQAALVNVQETLRALQPLIALCVAGAVKAALVPQAASV